MNFEHWCLFFWLRFRVKVPHGFCGVIWLALSLEASILKGTRASVLYVWNWGWPRRFLVSGLMSICWISLLNVTTYFRFLCVLSNMTLEMSCILPDINWKYPYQIVFCVCVCMSHMLIILHDPPATKMSFQEMLILMWHLNRFMCDVLPFTGREGGFLNW